MPSLWRLSKPCSLTLSSTSKLKVVKKAGQDVLARLSLLKNSLEEKRLNPSVCAILRQLSDCLDQNNFGGADQCHKQLTIQHWAEVKEWCNALKAVVQLKKKMG